MPPTSVSADCTYFSSHAYMGYTFDAKLYPTEAAYPCPPSFAPAGDGGQAWFCTLQGGQMGFTGFPRTAQAECGAAASGVIGYSWPV